MRKSCISLLFGLMACSVPAAASTINLNTGNGSSPYTITADTLSPPEGTTVNVVTSLGAGWINDLSSEWIAPLADQLDAISADAGYVTYQTTFTLPTGLNAGSTLSIELAADDWVQISLNGGSVFYTGPSNGQDFFDTVVPVSSAVDNELTTGLNTLQFVVWNTGTYPDAGGGPTGLDAQVTVDYTTTVDTPESGSGVLLLSGIGLLGLVMRKRIALGLQQASG
jgi:hypothetical protein